MSVSYHFRCNINQFNYLITHIFKTKVDFRQILTDENIFVIHLSHLVNVSSPFTVQSLWHAAIKIIARPDSLTCIRELIMVDNWVRRTFHTDVVILAGATLFQPENNLNWTVHGLWCVSPARVQEHTQFGASIVSHLCVNSDISKVVYSERSSSFTGNLS